MWFKALGITYSYISVYLTISYSQLNIIWHGKYSDNKQPKCHLSQVLLPRLLKEDLENLVKSSNSASTIVTITRMWLCIFLLLGPGGRTLFVTEICNKYLLNEWYWPVQEDGLLAWLSSPYWFLFYSQANFKTSKNQLSFKKPRDKPRHIWTPYLWQRRQEYAMEKRQPLK